MFEIYGGQKVLKQWSKNQRLVVNELPLGAEVHFYNDVTEEHPLQTAVYDLIDESGKVVRVCDIPNTFLRQTNTIKVCIPEKMYGLYGIRHTLSMPRERYILVEPAEKPVDYVYIETALDPDCDHSIVEIPDEQLKHIVDRAVAEAITNLELSDEKLKDIIAEAVDEAIDKLEISDEQLKSVVKDAVDEVILDLELSDEKIENVIRDAVYSAIVDIDDKLKDYVLEADLGVVTAADIEALLAKEI